MPVYMDRHNLPGITAKDVAWAHQQDLNIQHRYGCRALTYWFDEERQTAFCLIEAPTAEAVRNLHNDAHGLVPHQIIEVQKELIESFLGRIEDPGPAEADNFISETARRAIMALAFNPVHFQPDEKSKVAEKEEAIRQIRKAWQRFNGREVESSDEVYLTSFISVAKAVSCALEIQKAYLLQAGNGRPGQTKLCIGLSAGVPVTESKSLFGDAVQLARRLCLLPGRVPVMASAAFKGLSPKENTGSGGIIKILNTAEESFLNRLMDVAEERWQDSTLSTTILAKAVGVSKAQLYRKTIALANCSPLYFLEAF